MTNILVVFTGGTIGSKISGAVIDVEANTGYELLERFKAGYSGGAVQFDTISPLNILSENCNYLHWQKLYDALCNSDMDKYDGIIVTHGSDTLPYTAAMLSFAFPKNKTPIVVTASNYPLHDERSNGVVNFTTAVEFIISSEAKGVYVTFRKNNGKNVVYLGSRLQEADSYCDEFISFGSTELGEIVEGRFILYENSINPSSAMLAEEISTKVQQINFENNVFAIRAYPNLDYTAFNFKRKPKAILHSLYHSATASTVAGDLSLPEFIKRCKGDGIDFYIISFKSTSDAMYATSSELLAAGAVPLKNISFEAALAKLNIAYSQKELPPVEYATSEMFYEFLLKH